MLENENGLLHIVMYSGLSKDTFFMQSLFWELVLKIETSQPPVINFTGTTILKDRFRRPCYLCYMAMSFRFDPEMMCMFGSLNGASDDNLYDGRAPNFLPIGGIPPFWGLT